MKRILLMAVTALLLLTQCRKQAEITPDSNTVTMTITAGPGRTDISTAGGIMWSENDKIYVSDGTKYKGYLTIVDGVDFQTGTFTGTLTDVPDGEYNFQFFYLGGFDYTGTLEAGTSTSVAIDFTSQNITANSSEMLQNASNQHIGYGTATGTVSDGTVSKINVTLTSKVAIAYFNFTSGGADYTSTLTLSGEHIYNSMTVGFGGTFEGTKINDGNITLAAGSAQRYVMLVPPTTVAPETLKFNNGDIEGTAHFSNGIKANKFYQMPDGTAIAVRLSPLCLTGEFRVSATTTVKFSRGNLYYEPSTKLFKMEENQWDFQPTSNGNWVTNHVSHFFWSNTTDWQTSGKEPYASKYSFSTRTESDVFFTNKHGDESKPNPDFTVEGWTGTWRTLSNAEWIYVLNVANSTSDYRQDANRFAKAMVNGVKGLVVFPDGYNGNVVITPPAGMAAINQQDAAFPTTSIGNDTWSVMESYGAVFLPTPGYRDDTDVKSVGLYGNYVSSAPDGMYDTFVMYFDANLVSSRSNSRFYGRAVRLVRSGS